MPISTSMSDTDRIEGKATPKSLRCPYCVENREFKLLEPRLGANGWYMCNHCGHLAMPMASDFRCRCANCVGIDRKSRLRLR